VHVLYDNEIRTREDLDEMEEAIRNVRMTMSSASASGTRRCNILETAAYMAMRLTLLRWVSAYGNDDDDVPRPQQTCMCHIGNGISLRATWPEGALANVRIIWRHSDNDGSLPTASKVQPRGHDDDDDDDFSRSSKRGKKKNS
jgi:hypothetical protein